MKFNKVGAGKKLCESNHKVSTPVKNKASISEDLKKRMRIYEAKHRALIKEDTEKTIIKKAKDLKVGDIITKTEPNGWKSEGLCRVFEVTKGFGEVSVKVKHLADNEPENWAFDYDDKIEILVKSMDEAFAKQINLTDIAAQVANKLGKEELGDSWIEFEYGEERTLMGSDEKHIPFKAIGEYETKAGYMRTSKGRVDVVIRNGSEAKCDSVDEIARFIEGLFHYQGIKNEALDLRYGRRPEPSPEKKKLLALLDDLTFYIDRDNEELIDKTLAKMVNFRKGITEDVEREGVPAHPGFTKEFLDTIPNSEDFEQYSKYADLDSAREEIPSAPETPEDTGIAGILNNLIIDEWEAIDGYNSAIVTLTDLGKYDEVDVLKDIVNEENIHVGQLQKVLELVSPNAASIGEGEAEAAEQLNSDKGEIDNE